MKQLIQNLKSGETSIIEVPAPSISRNKILIHTSKSLISPGTEKMLVDFAKSGYVAKAKQQPDKVKEVINKVKTDGIASTFEAVQNKLNQPITLGYCNVGVIKEVGDNVSQFSIGDRVVSNGNHSEMVSVSKNLCAKIPDNVTDDEASFTVLGAIGLQGVRLAKPTLGEYFVVFGLGVIGLLTVQILKAHGCKVLAIDPQEDRLKLAKSFGADVFNPAKKEDIIAYSKYFSNQQGIDGVIITASTTKSDLISDAAKMCRKRGRIILIGVTGLNLSRDDFYEKELTFQVSCSYGPGRYDKNYEEGGNDYPIGFVRWTEQRNFEAILHLMESKKIDVSKLISHQIKFDEAPSVYSKISKGETGLGMIFDYESKLNKISSKNISLQDEHKNVDSSFNNTSAVVSFIGAGNYASRVLIPAFKKNNVQFHTLLTSNGLSGTIHGKNSNFKFSSTDVDNVISNDEINTLVIASRHDSHSEYVCKALKAKKNVYVEKPLAIDKKGLNAIRDTYQEVNKKSNCAHLMVGFNRRFSPHIIKMKELISKVTEPKSIVMTMNAGSIANDHWVHDSSVGGGRIIGEACHYIDLMRFLMDQKIESATSTSFGPSISGKLNEDTVTITIKFNDGSFGTIHYFSNGSNGYPKETINVFVGGKILNLNNFRVLKGFGWKTFKRMRTWTQDKGQNNCVKGFLNDINQNKATIPFDELYEVALCSIDVAENLRK